MTNSTLSIDEAISVLTESSTYRNNRAGVESWMKDNVNVRGKISGVLIDPNEDKVWLVVTDKKEAFIVYMPGSRDGGSTGDAEEGDYRDALGYFKKAQYTGMDPGLLFIAPSLKSELRRMPS